MTCIRTEPTHLPRPSLSVPGIVDLSDFSDPLRGNQAISRSYHEFSVALSACLGTPDLSNWCTFGQFASHGIGALISEFDTFLGQPDGARGDWLLGSLQHLPSEMKALSALLELSIKRTLPCAADERSMGRILATVLDIRHVLPQVVAHLSASVRRLRDNLIRGNRQIYMNVVPACQRFLLAMAESTGEAPGALSFSPERDPRGFLQEAFCAYRRVRELGDVLRRSEPGPQWDAAFEARAALLHHANLLLGYQEQLVIVQPIFDEIQEEMKAISPALYLADPRGTYRLLPNGGSWGVFYQRMGIDAQRAPADPAFICPQALPPMLSCEDPHFQGTIGQYFATGLLDPALQVLPAGYFPPAPVLRRSSPPFTRVLSGLSALLISAA